jgi:hypothetical protein
MRNGSKKRREKKRGYNILKILIAWGCKKTQVIYSPLRKEEERERVTVAVCDELIGKEY